jgi:hypothetical protein
MFFHIDEAGNSGNNLFDGNQPNLSYGVLSSKINIDAIGAPEHDEMLRQVGETSIHATDLGVEGLLRIVPALTHIYRRFDFRFDYCFVHKRSFAVIMLFNAVFDTGVNEAVEWHWYWTPLKFRLLLALDGIIDDELLREAWSLVLASKSRLDKDGKPIADLLSSLLQRVSRATIDGRAREVISNALQYGIDNPLKLDFGSYARKMMSPNAVGFQLVCQALALRAKAAKQKVLGITVDQQTEFNAAQLETYRMQSKLAESFRKDPKGRNFYMSHPSHEGVQEEIGNLISHLPTREFVVKSSEESIGLQMVDIFLWLENRMSSGSGLPPKLQQIVTTNRLKGKMGGMSVDAMKHRWQTFEDKMLKQGYPPFVRP